MKKVIAALLVGLSSISPAYADMADWTGDFLVDNKNQTISIGHTPTNVDFDHMFIVGKCLVIGKGVKLNGITYNDNIEICTNSNVETFIGEVVKCGTVVSQKVKLGSNYTSK